MKKSKSLSTYKGLPVVNRLNVPIIDIKNKDGLLAKREELKIINFDEFTLDEIVLVVKEDFIKFPYVTDENLEQEKTKLLKSDFPTLSPEDIQENILLIEEYYQKSLDYLVYNKLTKLKENRDYKSKSSKSYDDISDYLTDKDKTIACLRKKGVFKSYGGFSSIAGGAMALYALKEAANATDIAAKEFPNLKGGDTKQDAYRHILWSALLCDKYLTVSSKSPKLKFAKAVTDAYEECGTDNKEDSHQMDYHNNAIGRKLYNDNTPYRKVLWMKVSLRSPSLSLLKTKTKEMVDDAFFLDNNIGTIEERANKIRRGKFNCITKYHKQRRYVCGGGSGVNYRGNAGPPGDGAPDTKCWKTFYVPYQSCNTSKAVYISKELKK